MVLSRAALTLGIGVLVGVVTSVWASRLVGSLDGIERGVGGRILAIVGASAAWLPAWRASRTDPAIVLRNALPHDPVAFITTVPVRCYDAAAREEHYVQRDRH